MKIGIVSSKSNASLMNIYLEQTTAFFKADHISEENIKTYHVPGCLEIPRFAKKLAESGSCDIVICLGIVLGADHPSFQLMGQALFSELMRLSSDGPRPILNGIIMAKSPEQAEQDINYYSKKLASASFETYSLTID